MYRASEAQVTKNAVKQLREALGLPQDKFAALLMLSRVTVIRWESGEQAPQGLWLPLLRLLRKGLDKRGPEEMLRELRDYIKAAGPSEDARQDAMVECIALLATKTLAELLDA